MVIYSYWNCEGFYCDLVIKGERESKTPIYICGRLPKQMKEEAMFLRRTAALFDPDETV